MFYEFESGQKTGGYAYILSVPRSSMGVSKGGTEVCQV